MNKNLLNCIMGTIDSCPFAPRCHMIDPASAYLGAGIISGGASLIGNILGFGSNQSANQTNIEIARMNNEAQAKMLRSQQVYNEQMWNKQNEYNLPKNQVQRLLAAGINPASVFGNGSVSEAGQLTAPQLPSLQQAHVNPFTPDLSGIGDAVNAYFDNQLKSKSIEGMEVDNNAKRIDLQYKTQQILLDMAERRQRIDESLSRSNLNNQERDNLVSQKRDLDNRIRLFEENFEYLSKREKLQNDVLKQQADNLLSDSTFKRAQASFTNLMYTYYPQMTEKQMNVLDAQFGDLVQSAQLKIKEGTLKSAQATSQYLRNGLDAISYGKESLKDKARNHSKATKVFYGSLDMIGDIMFSNFGKLFK